MKPWLRYAICILLGAVGGCGYAISQVRGDYTAKQISNGPWNANTIQGTEKATALIRAKRRHYRIRPHHLNQSRNRYRP